MAYKPRSRPDPYLGYPPNWAAGQQRSWLARDARAKSLGLAQRFFALEFQPVGVVYQPIEDRVGERRVADRGVPGADGQLTGDDGGAPVVALLDDLKQVTAVTVGWRQQSPVVEHQNLGARQRGE